jgi:hypothetical protein
MLFGNIIEGSGEMGDDPYGFIAPLWPGSSERKQAPALCGCILP